MKLNSIFYHWLGSIDRLYSSAKNSIVNMFHTLEEFLFVLLFIISLKYVNKMGSFYNKLKPKYYYMQFKTGLNILLPLK